MNKFIAGPIQNNTFLAFQPLHITGKSVDAELALMVRILTIYLLIVNNWLPLAPFNTSYFYIAAHLQTIYELNYLHILLMMYTGSTLILFSSWIRLGSLLSGTAIALGVMHCHACLSVAHLFTASIFLITFCSNRVTGNYLLRGQIALLYIGADLHKIIDPDWWTGMTMETMLVVKHRIDWFKDLAGLFPALLLSRLISWAVMIIQILIPIFLTQKRWTHYAITSALLLHIPMVLMVGITFGPFVMALTVAYGALLTWPRLEFSKKKHSKFLYRILVAADFNDQFKPEADNLNLKIKSQPFKLAKTIIDFICHPLLLFLLCIFASLLSRLGFGVSASLIAPILFFWKEGKKIRLILPRE